MNPLERAMNLNPWAAVDQFEADRLVNPQASLKDYLPPESHPEYLDVLIELVRLDLELTFTQSGRAEPEQHFKQFPILKANSELASVVVFEAYRLLQKKDITLDAETYANQFGVCSLAWPDLSQQEQPKLETKMNRANVTPFGLHYSRLIRQLPPDSVQASASSCQQTPSDQTQIVNHRGKPEIDEPTPAKPTEFPELGEKFLDFELLKILGNGSFGRVYLARQRDLANRQVAIKVGQGLFSESHTLAQLQHTNIVPIYSLHNTGSLQAICMPYFGSCTFAHWITELRREANLPRTGPELATRLAKHLQTHSTVLQPETNLPPTSKLGPQELVLVTEQPARIDAAINLAAPVWTEWQNRSYIQIVIQLISQLAAGLAHAHSQGIIHRDLKPANVLLTDDGISMLLDFNIAQDTKRNPFGQYSVIGGTLPYMAPEQLEAYRGQKVPLDARIDLYALGVLAFELLTGRRPYPDRLSADGSHIEQMLGDRRATPSPSVCSLNAEVSPGLESILHKLLALKPEQRYQSANDLQVDLNAYLTDAPLVHATERSLRERSQKWFKRNPWARSTWTIASAALAAMIACTTAVLAVRERNRSLEAQLQYDQHLASFRDLQYQVDDRSQTRGTDAGITRCEEILARYGLSSQELPGNNWENSQTLRYLPPTEREQVRESLGEVYYLMAKIASRRADVAKTSEEKAQQLVYAQRWNQSADRLDPSRIQRALILQRQELLQRTGEQSQAQQLLDTLKNLQPQSARDRYLFGYWHYQQGRLRQALPELIAATREDPTHFSSWFVRGITHLQLEQNDLALMCFTAGVALRPDFAPAWQNRGQAFLKLRKYDMARIDFEKVLQLDPQRVEALILQGGAFQAQGHYRDAEAAYSEALNLPTCPTRVYFFRAVCREQLKNSSGAKADRAEALKQTPQDELSWVARAEHRTHEPELALADLEQALKLNPLSLPAYQMQAHLLSEHLHRIPEAISALDRAIQFYPDSVPALAGRGVLHARNGNRTPAHQDAQLALERDSNPENLYQVACIYALTAKQNPEDRFKAIELLRTALKGGFGREYLRVDHDLDPIRKSAEFQRLVAEFPPQ